MSVNLAEFIPGKGYYETKYKDMIEDIDIDRLMKYIYRIETQLNSIPIASINGPSLDDAYFTDITMVWRIPHKLAKYSLKNHYESYAARKDLQVILRCCIEYGMAYGYNQFEIFTRLVIDRDYNDINVIMGKFVPREIEFSEFEDYDEMTLTCYGYELYQWYGKFSEIFLCHQIMLQKRELLLKSEMGISDARYEKFAKGLGDLFRFAPVPYLPDTVDDYKVSDYVCKLPTPIELKANAKAFGEMVASLKDLYEYDFLKKCKEVFSIKLANDLLPGGSNMNILNQLPKIKRLERNGAFTTAVWEDGTVTKLKKSDQDEDDFEKLVFFLILKKLCDNNTHKMHETLTDYLNTFHDATVDIPKQKEEKAEKKRKAKEEAEENANVGS